MKCQEDLKVESGDGLSRALCSDLGVRFCHVRISDACVNQQDELSPGFSLSQFGWVFPLLTELSVEDPTWWLLDSGASICVLADAFEQVYNFRRSGDSTDGFRAANGTPVNMLGSGVVTVGLDVEKDKKRMKTKGKIKAYVGRTKHNIRSTTMLCNNGWKITQEKGHVEVLHQKTGQKLFKTAFFANCSWVQLSPCCDNASGPNAPVQVVADSGADDPSELSAVGDLNPVTRVEETELQKHRMNGHQPYDPRCIDCNACRGVYQHRKRERGCLNVELQADFCFISETGDFVDGSTGKQVTKVLVLTELQSSCVGYVVCGDNVWKTRELSNNYLFHFGLVTQKASVIRHTDRELAVSEFIRSANEHFDFKIVRAPPQQHEHVGGVERSVRRLKESMNVIRSDLNRQGLDVKFSGEPLKFLLQYLATMHNGMGRAPGSDLTPLESVVSRKLTKPVVTLFASTVLAELPDSVLKDLGTHPRSIEACFLFLTLDGAPVVQGLVRKQGSLVLQRFTARAIKPLLPLSWDPNLFRDVLAELGTDQPLKPRPAEPTEVLPSLEPPKTGPP